MNDKHALIIDDNRLNVLVLATSLAKQGLSHTALLQPEQLSDTLIQTDHFDIVFVDLEMPGLDGFDVLAKLQSDERFRGVPIVAYTVHASELNVAHQAGFHSFIPKPIDPQRFPGQLERILRGEQVWERV